MNLVNRLDGVEVVNTRVETDFVQHHDSGSLSFFIEGTHRGGYIAGGDNMSLSFDGGLDDRSMESVGNEGNDEVVFSNRGVESIRIVDINRNSSGVRQVGCEGFSACKGSAG